MTDHIVLPFPPSRNHTHVTTRQGRRVPKKEYREYIEAVRAILRASDIEMMDMVPDIYFFLYWPNRRRSDQDNRLKIVRDALVGYLFKDDCWTCLPQEHIYNDLDKDNPRIEVEWYTTEELS